METSSVDLAWTIATCVPRTAVTPSVPWVKGRRVQRSTPFLDTPVARSRPRHSTLSGLSLARRLVKSFGINNEKRGQKMVSRGAPQNYEIVNQVKGQQEVLASGFSLGTAEPNPYSYIDADQLDEFLKMTGITEARQIQMADNSR